MHSIEEKGFGRTTRLLTLFCAILAWGALSPFDSHAQTPPSNDNFVNAQGINGLSGSVVGNNLNATAEPNEPLPCPNSTNGDNYPFQASATIWYVWTAPASATINFNTRGSVDSSGNQLPTLMTVYTGPNGQPATLANLNEVTYTSGGQIFFAEGDSQSDPAGGVDSWVYFPAVEGTTYYIQIDGDSDGQTSTNEGTIDLDWGASKQGGSFLFASSTSDSFGYPTFTQCEGA